MGIYIKLDNILFNDKNFGVLNDVVNMEDGLVNYLEGDGASYIDTMWSGYRIVSNDTVGVIPNEIPRFVVEVDVNNLNNCVIVGIIDDETTPCLAQYKIDDEYTIQYVGKGANFSKVPISSNVKNVIEVGSVYSYLNGVQISDNLNMSTQYRLNAFPNNNLILFGGLYTRTGTGTNFEIANGLRIYSFKAYQGDELILDLRPYKKDGVGCMIDLLTGTIYENKGTGSFIIG